MGIQPHPVQLEGPDSYEHKWRLSMTTLLVTFDLPSLVAAVTNARISDGSQGAWRTETPAEEPTLGEGAAHM